MRLWQPVSRVNGSFDCVEREWYSKRDKIVTSVVPEESVIFVELLNCCCEHVERVSHPPGVFC